MMDWALDAAGVAVIGIGAGIMRMKISLAREKAVLAHEQFMKYGAPPSINDVAEDKDNHPCCICGATFKTYMVGFVLCAACRKKAYNDSLLTKLPTV